MKRLSDFLEIEIVKTLLVVAFLTLYLLGMLIIITQITKSHDADLNVKDQKKENKLHQARIIETSNITIIVIKSYNNGDCKLK